jgi:hypothetical protein
MKINPNILMEWIFDSEHYVSENYNVITNLNENKKRSFLSTSNLNNKNNNLFQLDPVLRKYSIVNTTKYNFLQQQDYNSAPIPYDIVRIYLPTSFNFVYSGYVGLYLKIFAYGFYNKNVYELSNIFFDATSTSNSGLTQLAIPFIYDGMEWGKYYQFEVPSVDFVSNQRITSSSQNIVIANTINSNLAPNEGLSQTGPIFVDFQFLTTKEITLGTTYYYSSESYRSSFPKAAEFNTLGVTIIESLEGDFFEIWGTYGQSNENLDNFVREVENKGRKIRIEYDIYLYEENIQTNKQTVTVIGPPEDDFTKKIYYRPILTFSNTTAAIKVEMKVIDLVDMSTISRFATIGLDGNIQKYGKKLLSLNVANINKLKIYNAKPDEIILGKDYFSGNITSEIIKVPYPQLIQVGNIVVNSPTSAQVDKMVYKGLGLLNIIITPFDNVIQFRLGRNNDQGQFELYNLADISNNSDLTLVFKSDSEVVEKSIYREAENDYVHGNINFKITENDLAVLKKIYDKGATNFYLVLTSKSPSNVKTLLYSGTFNFYDNIKFIENTTAPQVQELNTQTSEVSTQTQTQITESDWPKAGKTVVIYTKYKGSTTSTTIQ